MSHRLAVSIAIACTLAIVSCSGEDDSAVGPRRPAATSTSTSSTTAPTTQPAAELEPVGTFWTLDPAFPVSDADTSVHVLLQPPECGSGLDREPFPADVAVVDGEIRITAFIEGVDEPNGECTFRSYPTVVDLGMPIDGRPLVDAVCLTGGSRVGPNPPEWCVERP